MESALGSPSQGYTTSGRGLFRGRGHGRDGPGRDPSGGHVHVGHDRHPSNPQSTVPRRGVVVPNGLLRMAVESSTPHAICNGVRLDTNSLPPT